MRRAVLTAMLVLSLIALLNGGALASSVILGGDYLQVAVNDSGALINDDASIGVNLDPGGGGAYTIADFITPGSPFEFYSLGVGGVYIDSGLWDWNPFNGVTADTSWGTQLTADTSARWDGLGIYQNAWFDKEESTIHFVVTLTNTRRAGAGSFFDVAYARGADPDQDVYVGGDFPTNNSIGPGGVTAVGPATGWSMTLLDTWGGGVYSVDTWWDTDPYNLLVPHNDGNGDYAINCAWDLGTLAPGTSKSISFDYVFVAPGLPAFALVGAAPVLGALIRRRKR